MVAAEEEATWLPVDVRCVLTVAAGSGTGPDPDVISSRLWDRPGAPKGGRFFRPPPALSMPVLDTRVRRGFSLDPPDPPAGILFEA